jgi:hypothetical protein
MRRDGKSRESLRAHARPLPPVKEWSRLIARAPLGVLDSWAMGWYGDVRSGIPSFYAPSPSPLDDIPFEEQVLCIAILDLDRRTFLEDGP